MQDVKDAVAESDRRVVFHFKSNQNRELPLVVGGLPVLPMKWWATRDFSKPLTEPPLGSGPYKVEKLRARAHRDLCARPELVGGATCRPGAGSINFDRVRIEYFRDPTVAFQAFKAGQIDYRQENISKQWATGYDFPAVRQRAGAQGGDRARAAARDPGLDHEHAAAAVQGSRGCARRWARCSTSSG